MTRPTLSKVLAVTSVLSLSLRIHAEPFSAQHAFFAHPQVLSDHHDHPLRVANADDPGRFPNLKTRLEVTSADRELFCGQDGDKHVAGYAHITNSEGEEDKHLFWWMFEARHEPENAPVVLVFGGGPGTSGLLSATLGEGPCIIGQAEDGNPTLQPAPFSWTERVNLLAVDYPVGAGYSYGAERSLRRTSEEAAWDLDDFLQSFWRKYPALGKNQFLVHSGSYGGLYIPNLIHVIRQRNLAAKSIVDTTRLHKMPDVMMSNVWSDAASIYRHYIPSECDDLGFYNATGCHALAMDLPECLDMIQYAYEQPSEANKFNATFTCGKAMHGEFLEGRDMSDNRCPDANCLMRELSQLAEFINGTQVREALGVPASRVYNVISPDVALPFIFSGDRIQQAYKLLAPAIEDGLRVLVYNGANDGLCPRRSTLGWMNLLQSKYQDDFRSAPEVDWPGVGWFKQAGVNDKNGAGNFTFVSVLNAGHGPFKDQPEATRDLLFNWLANEPFI